MKAEIMRGFNGENWGVLITFSDSPNDCVVVPHTTEENDKEIEERINGNFTNATKR